MQPNDIAMRISAENRVQLSEGLTDFWAEDTWSRDDLAKVCRVGEGNFTYRFTTGSRNLDVELKVAMKFLFQEKLWLPNGTGASKINLLCRFISRQIAPDSLLDELLPKWLFKLRAFLVENGYSTGSLRPCGNKRPNLAINTFSTIYETLIDLCDTRPLLDRENIILSKVCPKGSKTRNLRLTMNLFKQEWIKEAFRNYLKVRSNKVAAETLKCHHTHILNFSRFLNRFYPDIEPAGINREILDAYIDDLSRMVRCGVISHDYRCNAISYLKVFLEISRLEGFLMLGRSAVLYGEDIPQKNKSKPRFIPEKIVQQMIKHLHCLPLVRRLVLMLLLESGARINEILSLPINCLRKDHEGDYWLERYVSKQSKWHRVPVAVEIVALIKEWAEVVKEKYADQTVFLFPNVTGGSHLKYEGYVAAINGWICENSILDVNGEPFHLRTHDCRHTVASRMLDQGLAHHFISDFLGHDSPEITRVYAAIKRAQMQKVSERMHNARRATVGDNEKLEDFQVESIVQASQVRKHILAQRLPNGWCYLSVHQASCLSGGACLDCNDYFETTPEFLPVHRAQINDELKILQTAKEKNHQRQIEFTEKKIAKLHAVIECLEKQITK